MDMHSALKKLAWQAFTRSTRYLLSLLVIIIIATAACAPAEPAPVGTIAAALGRSVTIEGIPQRIISLAPSNTEILFALGLGDRIVGVTEFCNYPPEAEDKEKIGGFSTVDIERLIDLQPDLILASDIHASEVIPALQERGLIVFALAPQTLEGVLEDIQTVGKITGREKEAASLATQLEGRIQAITDKTINLEEKPGVFYITYHTYHCPLYSIGAQTLIAELIEKAGGTNIFQDSFTGHKIVTPEEVIARNPEVIIACSGHGEAKNKPFDWAKGEPILMATQASKENRIYQINADLTSRAGPRIVDALEYFAHYIHPEIFSEPEGTT